VDAGPDRQLSTDATPSDHWLLSMTAVAFIAGVIARVVAPAAADVNWHHSVWVHGACWLHRVLVLPWQFVLGKLPA